MKRRGDDAEDRGDAGPLFAAHARAQLAIEKAERVEPGWRANAVEAVRLFARTHSKFLAEEVRASFCTPDEADARSWGPVLKDAERLGYIAAGDAVRDQWGSWKTLWRSLIR